MNSKERIQETLDTFNSIGERPEGMQRLAYTMEERQVHDMFAELCAKAGMQVRVDEVGNVIARKEGRIKEASPVAIGSHLDTVYTGGKYDGTGGVVVGLEVVRRLNEKQVMTDHPIELIAFVAEESSRFGMSTIGSKAMAGLLSEDSTEKAKDKEGISLKQAMERAGFPGADIAEAKREEGAMQAFLELHIEQGQELERTGKKVAIATGVAAPTRLEVIVQGRSAHSGTTSMDIRKDALSAASRLVLKIEEAAKQESSHKTVATVGVLDVSSGAMNVVPGEVAFKVDIRGLDIASKQRVIAAIESESSVLESEKGMTISMEVLSDEEPILLDSEIQEVLKGACASVDIDPLYIPSGAGHDAMNMAKICPTGLLFVPSRNGISHNPEEFTPIEDFVTGADVLEQAVMKLAVTKEVKVSK
ncbi:Zn-dependent hydrolase [Salimicrobium halophilum]|uniref:N-carbamoyl-L-amino-acid hydrolase n=1 Tax=Salimicrobium halophilum TaxID=86666 RepID=A0A1G8UIK7_9BACI|nr:Zn-dependent hydrolase [Salimicrobium halophilum]SDJ52985.1 N-carbamoyl-L-amino-acid hydrolase [Salimicrobium halophilum]